MFKENLETLRIIETFASVQGESHTSGYPTTFIRLAACNLRCSWCDTEYSFGRGDPVAVANIIEQTDEYGCPYVCVTGGEPLLQKEVHGLMKQLCDKGYNVSVETGGSLDIEPVDPRVSVVLDIKCPGSGMSQKNLWSNMDKLRPDDEVKFVLTNIADYNYAKGVCEQYQLFDRDKVPLFSPVHDGLDPKDLVEWVLQDKLPIRLNLQIHKYIWTPETKGV